MGRSWLDTKGLESECHRTDSVTETDGILDQC